MHSAFAFYLGLTAFVWIFLQLITSPKSQTIFTTTLFRMTTWIYLGLSAVISALVMTLPVLVTGTISVTAILLAMAFRRVKKNSLINVAIFGDTAVHRALASNPDLLKARAHQCHRARQNYGIITMATNAAYVMAFLSFMGLLVAAVAALHTP